MQAIEYAQGIQEVQSTHVQGVQKVQRMTFGDSDELTSLCSGGGSGDFPTSSAHEEVHLVRACALQLCELQQST